MFIFSDPAERPRQTGFTGIRSVARNTSCAAAALPGQLLGAVTKPAHDPFDGLKLGLASYSVRKFTLAQAIAMTQQAGVKNIWPAAPVGNDPMTRCGGRPSKVWLAPSGRAGAPGTGRGLAAPGPNPFRLPPVKPRREQPTRSRLPAHFRSPAHSAWRSLVPGSDPSRSTFPLLTVPHRGQTGSSEEMTKSSGHGPLNS